HRAGELQLMAAPLSTAGDAIYADFFPTSGFSLTPRVHLKGDGDDTRSLAIVRGRGDVRIPAGAKTPAEAEVLSPIIFEWANSKRKKFTAGVRVSAKGIQFENTGEDLGAKWSFYAASTTVPTRESADHFSKLKRTHRADREFVRTFRDVFDWIDDISVESSGGSSALYASVANGETVVPLSMASGGVNRAAAILLSMAGSPQGIVMVDEIE